MTENINLFILLANIQQQWKSELRKNMKRWCSGGRVNNQIVRCSSHLSHYRENKPFSEAIKQLSENDNVLLKKKKKE
jgi:hypothetical protein